MKFFGNCWKLIVGKKWEVVNVNVLHAESNVGVGKKCAFEVILRKCEDENDADWIKTYFAIDFWIIFEDLGRVLEKSGGRGLCSFGRILFKKNTGRIFL